MAARLEKLAQEAARLAVEFREDFRVKRASRNFNYAKMLEDNARMLSTQARIARYFENTRSARKDLGSEWQRQAQGYVELGFHAELGLSEKDYLASLPKFKPQPERFKGRFNIPVLVDPRISPQRQAELLGLDYHLGDSKVSDWEDPKGYKTPKVPYTTWMRDVSMCPDRQVEYARREFAQDERGATIYDGMGLLVARPNTLDHFCVDLPGTVVGSGSAPWLGLGFGEGLGVYSRNSFYRINSFWRAVYCGRN